MLPPPLETDEEKCCLIALVDKNVAMSKEQAKKQLIEHNLRLVVYLAKKFEKTCEKLIQDMTSRNQKMFSVTIVIMLLADNEEEMDKYE